jgi:PAS domain-containing protein
MRASRRIEETGAGSAAGAGRLAVRGIVAELAADLAFALLQATDYGILMIDPQGRDLVGNRRFGELFGVDVGGVVEMSRSEVREARHARLRDPEAFFERVDAIYQLPDWAGWRPAGADPPGNGGIVPALRPSLRRGAPVGRATQSSAAPSRRLRKQD